MNRDTKITFLHMALVLLFERLGAEEIFENVSPELCRRKNSACKQLLNLKSSLHENRKDALGTQKNTQ